MTFGYIDELIPDPVAYYKDYVKRKNEKRSASVAEETCPRAFAAKVEKNVGHFLVYSLLTELGVKETIDILASQRRFQFSVYDMISQLIYARILDPCSKSKTASNVFLLLYNGVLSPGTRSMTEVRSSGNPTKYISSSSTTAMHFLFIFTIQMPLKNGGHFKIPITDSASVYILSVSPIISFY